MPLQKIDNKRIMFKGAILVTGVGGDIGQGVLKCLKDTKYNLKIIGTDMDPYAAGRIYVEKFFHSPGAWENETYLDFIKKLIEEENVQYILPTTETEIEVYNVCRDYFEAKNIKLFINNPFIIETFLDKYETVNFLKNNGLPYPRTYILETYNNELSFPLLLKLRKGWGGKGAVVIKDAEELIFFKKRTNNAIIQEIVGTPDDEYTVGVFSTGSKVYSIAFKRFLGYGSLTKVAKLVEDVAIKNLAETIAKTSFLEGSLNIQLRKTDKGYVPLEVNPRFSSTVYFRHCFGFQDVKWWIDLKEGRNIEYALKYREGVAVRTISETFFDLVL